MRDVSETARECNIKHSGRFSSQSDRCTAKSRSQQILMRRCARKVLKHSKEVVRTQSGNLREATQVVRHAGFIVDPSHNPCNARQGTWFCTCSSRHRTLCDLYRLSCQLKTQFFARHASRTCEEG